MEMMNMAAVKALEREEVYMKNIIKERLEELGYKNLEGKSLRELKVLLAATDAKVDSPHNSWF